ncbi:MAG: hypothetical protein VX589_09165 [Myxococcota bacterium]|nr:hypothetical protein [Myxococcota bacterium]
MTVSSGVDAGNEPKSGGAVALCLSGSSGLVTWLGVVGETASILGSGDALGRVRSAILLSLVLTDGAGVDVCRQPSAAIQATAAMKPSSGWHLRTILGPIYNPIVHLTVSVWLPSLLRERIATLTMSACTTQVLDATAADRSAVYLP